MLYLAICDDDPIELKKLVALIKDWSAGQHGEAIEVTGFTSPQPLLDTVARGTYFDLFLLDILMPEMTGIFLGEQLRQLLTDPLLIYLTTSEDYYPEAFRLYAFQYLCKPICKTKLFPVMDKALSHCKKQKSDVFLLKTAQGMVRLPFHMIVYVELSSHICHFYLADGRHLESLYLRTGFDCFLEQLTQREQFIKTHTSFVVNLDFAEKLTANALTLFTGKTVPVARSFAGQVQRRYIAYGLREEK